MALDWLEPTGARDRQPIYVHGRSLGCRIHAESMHCVALAENMHIWDLGYLGDAQTRGLLRSQHIWWQLMREVLYPLSYHRYCDC